MKTAGTTQLKIAPPPIVIVNWGHSASMLREGTGGGQMHKRITPKVFGHAKQLHRNMTKNVRNTWNQRLQGVPLLE